MVQKIHPDMSQVKKTSVLQKVLLAPASCPLQRRNLQAAQRAWLLHLYTLFTPKNNELLSLQDKKIL